nr:MAG TPA: hypothetical protein [Caudoviricetes sp.]
MEIKISFLFFIKMGRSSPMDIRDGRPFSMSIRKGGS